VAGPRRISTELPYSKPVSKKFYHKIRVNSS
jgi:hypothetical protein